MKEKILNLRNEGKTYNEIKDILGCSKSTISYYCGDGQKEKNKNRNKKRRENILLAKVETFKNVRNRKSTVEALRKFQKRSKMVDSKIDNTINKTFTWEDVIEIFGENTICYLSGVKINLYENNYNLDHSIPKSRGGLNILNNLGVTHKIVNAMKSDLMVDELLDWCIKILKHNGYEINK